MMDRRSLLLTIALGISTSLGCGGKEGPQGPAGPPGPAGAPNRNAIYCRSTTTDAALADSYTLRISCDAAADFPIEGSCSSGTLPLNYYLAQNEPVDWGNRGAAPAQWVCAWRPGNGDAQVPTIAGTFAFICCVPP